ncbi:SPRY domain-containing protein 3-like isoform X1 [Dreissena polymorpha]|nr:SPRY domain-containing protein 3-like isoform X1 [Dreissena polymorpha]XP_052251321.1 SPRY domain-containing protein 3-like isoform X1 [Dreissena polymorpha]XP_052251322.1 SPRY domain-containing protein 3-like isoform X1 [Dreissena polymorpha]XP_052251323.1 SPRY domain-containing protein 3-like isoform X1 [Dreissena polymorpha]
MSRKPVSANYYSTDSDSADTPERPQRDLSWPARYERINVDGNHLSFVSDDTNMDGLYVAAKPLCSEHGYFEIEIDDNGLNSEIGIGLVPYTYPLGAMPGWEAFSVGYRADDGDLYKACSDGSTFGAKCNIGDIMGCGIKFAKSEEERRKLANDVQVFFTRNGKEVGTVTVPYPPGGLYPAVGMHSDGAKVRLILDAELQYELHDNELAGMGRDDLSKRNQLKKIVLNALGLKTWKEVQDSYDQADNMFQYQGDASTSEGRIQFLTSALELAKIGKTNWSVNITVKRNGVEIPVDKQLMERYSDQILKEIKQKF